MTMDVNTIPVRNSPAAAAAEAARARQADVDRAIRILENTHDGDDLARRDLALLQHVVNHGRAALTELGLKRWEDVVNAVADGSYVKPWLHGVENLSKDHDGYVKWRGRVVEHYSFRDDEGERAAAQQLGECCRFLEAKGRPVRSMEVMKAYDEANHGQGLGLGRWLVVWHTGTQGARTAVMRLREENANDSSAEIYGALPVLTADWGAEPDAIRHFKVITREDFESAKQQLEQSCSWARHAVSWLQYCTRSNLNSMLDTVTDAIREAELPSRAEIMRRYFAEGDNAREGDRPGRMQQRA
ncbi:hypothetical protein [Ramlibacter sp. AN1133]|uniref:hypothetical protein n=1 Tax=Ramlibacter sp. AN1133 TaxID=3133429 RepID=UPI0030C28615